MRRPEIKKQDPKMAVTDVTKKISKEWKALSADDKKMYVNMAEIDKKRYTK